MRLGSLAPALLAARPPTLPLYGVARLSCHGACACGCVQSAHGAFRANCTFDGLQPGRATVTNFLRLKASDAPDPAADSARLCGAPGLCAVRVANGADAAEPDGRYRVVVRALIVGLADWRTKWINAFYEQKS